MIFQPSNYYIHWIVVLAIILKVSTSKQPGVLAKADLVKRQDFLKGVEAYLSDCRGLIASMALSLLRKEIADIEILLLLNVSCIGTLSA